MDSKKRIQKALCFEEPDQVPTFELFIDWGETEAILIMDDYGYKSGLLMSPKNYRTYVMP
ncbi:MAG: hypothetical protein ACFE9I_15450 [Candidatus Hermodarchaeota archaeon]